MAGDYSRELHPGYLAIVVATGLLATFIAQLVPDEYSVVGAALVVAILLIGTVVYFSRLPEKRDAPLLSYLRFSLVAFVVGVAIGVLARLIPTLSFEVTVVPDWVGDFLGYFSYTMIWTVHECVYAGTITLVAVVAYWSSRGILRPVSFVAAGLAGAVLVEFTLPRDMGALPGQFDPVLTYVAWGVFGVLVVLVNAFIPSIVSEMRRFFTRS